ncbi:MAG: hypothetical protein WD157_01030 [Patescibacteria group bacterium]
MGINNYVLIGYGVFLAILLAINLLYFFQVFKYRLPGDASIPVLTIHILLIAGILIFSSLLVLG